MFSQFWNSLYTIARRETDYEPKTHDQKPVITSHNQPQVHRFFWWFRSNFKTPTELPHFPPWLKATNKNWNAHPCNMATGYSVRSVWLSVCFCSLYLWVETEGFGRFPNTQQVKYDLLHGEIQSLLNRGQTYRCYRISELMWCEAVKHVYCLWPTMHRWDTFYYFTDYIGK